MAGVSIKLDIDWSPLADVLQQLENLPDNMFEPLDEIGQHISLAAQENIRQGREPDGTPLTPLAESTRERRGNDATILLEHGNLLNKYTSVIVDNRGVTVGNKADQAAVMHYGGKAGRKSKRVIIPARPVLGISKDDNDEIVNILRDFIISETGINV